MSQLQRRRQRQQKYLDYETSAHTIKPKTVAGIIFLVGLSTVAFAIGYSQGAKKADSTGGSKAKEGTKMGFIWLGASWGIFLIIGLMLYLIGGLPWYVAFLWGGELMQPFLQLIGLLVQAMFK